MNSSNIEEFLQDINSEVELLQADYKMPDVAFTQYVVSNIAELTGVNEFQVCNCVLTDRAGKNQGEIYGYGLSENEEVLTLYYSLYNTSSSKVENLNKDSFDLATNRLQSFYNKSIRGTHMDLADDGKEDTETYEVCKYIYEHHSKLQKISLCVLTNCMMNSFTISDLKKNRIDTKLVDVDVWAIDKIYANLHSGDDHVHIDIDFENDPLYSMYKLPCIEMSSRSFKYKCISTMFPAKLLYRLYEEHNTNLLQNNVRFFLDFKGRTESVNKSMKRTLEMENERFLAYNNGITAIAQNIELGQEGEQTMMAAEDNVESNEFINTGIIKRIEDFQIVNGGQTTACIFHAKKDNRKGINLQGVYVLVKLIVLESEYNQEMITNISKNTNSQNPVKFSDFGSNSAFNKSFENLALNNISPNEHNEVLYWFFERIQSQYKIEIARRKGKKVELATFKKQYPKDHVIKKEELAKIHMCWKQEPYNAVKGASTTYKSFLDTVVDKGKMVADERFFKESVALLIIYKFLMARPETKDYKNAKAPVVAYTMGYLSYITLKRLDLMKIWNRQGLSDELKVFLNKLSESIKSEFDKMVQQTGQTVLSLSKNKDTFGNGIKKCDFNCDLASINADMIND